MHAEIQSGIALLRQGQLADAERLCRQVLARLPDDPDALHYLGLARYRQGDPGSAVQLLSRSLQFDPTNANTWNDLGAARLQADQPREALDSFGEALKIMPTHADAMNNMAIAFKRLKRFAEALPLQRRLVDLEPLSPQFRSDLAETQYFLGNVREAVTNYRTVLWLAPETVQARLGLGEACESTGRFKQAQMHYRAVLRREPANGRALAKLLQLRDAVVEPRLLDMAQQMAADPTARASARGRLNGALAHYYDGCGQYDLAFQHLRKSCDERARQRPFDSAGYSRAIDLLVDTLSPAFFRRAPRVASSDPKPIFIIGMPRSGTTLTEQILASHSQVVAGGELSALPAASFRVQQLSAAREPYPRGLLQLSAAELQSLAAGYSARLRAIRGASKRRVTDKLPFNFMHLGMAALLFPDAHIIHCRRDALDNCLSCYFTGFAEENPFSNNLQALGRYYRDYDRLMSHWQVALPVPMFTLSYERLVSDTERTVRELLQFCELPWEPGCLKFNETAREVLTPSRWQVRQPMYAHSVGRWKHYEAHLDELKQALGPLADSTGAALSGSGQPHGIAVDGRASH